MTRPAGSGVKHIHASRRTPFTPDEQDTVRQMRRDNATLVECAQAIGRSYSSTENYVMRHRIPRGTGDRHPGPIVPPLVATVSPTRREWSESGESASLSITTHEPVRTLEQLIAVCEIDTAVWEIAEWKANTWEAAAKNADGAMVAKTLYQVTARLKRKAWNPSAVSEGMIAAIKANVRPLRPVSRPPSTNSGYLYVATIGEPHLGKMAWAPETGEHYDLDIACERVRQSHRHLMQRAAVLRPEKIAVVIGDDFFTADTPTNTTTAGTPQEVDGRYRKVFRRGVELCREIVEGWRQIAPVEVWIKVGNHDQTITWHAGEVLAAMYGPTADVTVINPDRLRHYQRWGTCLIGLTHGDKEKDDKLPMLMAHEAKADWADTTCRVWLTGHLHTLKAKTQRAVVQPMLSDVHEEMGVVIRRCRSLSGTDAWHAQLGYVGNIKAAEGFAFHATLGETDIHTGVIAEAA
jgi:hypothetical protein